MRRLPPPAACCCDSFAPRISQNGWETAEISALLCLEFLATSPSPTACAGRPVMPRNHRGHYGPRVLLGRLRPFLNRFCCFKVPYAERGHFSIDSPGKITKNGPGTISNGSVRARLAVLSATRTPPTPRSSPLPETPQTNLERPRSQRGMDLFERLRRL